MEHRYGVRYPSAIDVYVRSQSGSLAARGRLLDVSISGAFVSTAVSIVPLFLHHARGDLRGALGAPLEAHRSAGHPPNGPWLGDRMEGLDARGTESTGRWRAARAGSVATPGANAQVAVGYRGSPRWRRLPAEAAAVGESVLRPPRAPRAPVPGGVVILLRRELLLIGDLPLLTVPEVLRIGLVGYRHRDNYRRWDRRRHSERRHRVRVAQNDSAATALPASLRAPGC